MTNTTKDAAEKSAAKHDKEIADARAKAHELRTDAAEKRAKEDAAGATESEQEADDLEAKAAELQNQQKGPHEAHTVEQANVQGFALNPGLAAGSHFAQKFGNDPANPKTAAGLSDAPEARTCRLTRKTPDMPTEAVTFCQPEMVGDYLRAGWNHDTTYRAPEPEPAPTTKG